MCRITNAGNRAIQANLDNDLYKFNTDNTGTWSFNGQEYKSTGNTWDRIKRK